MLATRIEQCAVLVALLFVFCVNLYAGLLDSAEAEPTCNDATSCMELMEVEYD